jgi:hypothetical protein
MTIIFNIISGWFINWFKNPFSDENRNKTFIATIIILVLLLLHSCMGNYNLKQDIKRNKQIEENNYDALNGKITVLRNKKGELETVKTILYTSKNDLEKLNKKLSEELEKERGRVKTIIETRTVYQQVPVSVINTVEDYGYNKYGLKFNSVYRDSGVKSQIQGISRFKISQGNKIEPDSTTILKNEIEINVIYGTRERDGKLEVFARSPSPLIKFTDIQGAYITDNKTGGIIPPDKPSSKNYRWVLGPQLGYTYIQSERRNNIQAIGNLQYRFSDYTLGFQLGFGYNLGEKRPDIRTGFRLQYNIFKW